MVLPRKRDVLKPFLAILLALSLVVGLFFGEVVVDRYGKTITIGMVGHAYAVAPDYIVDGVDDHVQVQQALDALPAAGGKLKLLGATYSFGATVTRAIGEVTIEGMGLGTLINNDGATDIFDDGGQNNWLIQNLGTDAGGLSLTGADSQAQNVWIGGTFYTIWTDATTGTGTVVIPNDSIDDSELFTTSNNTAGAVGIDDLILGAAGVNSMPRWNGTNWVPAPGGNGTDIYWGVIDVSTGTDPFLVGANETLTFISDDLTITGTAGNDTIAFAYAANSIILGADTTGAYIATISDAGNAKIIVVGSGGEGATITLDAANATTTSTGIAMFDPANFLVNAGNTSIKNDGVNDDELHTSTDNSGNSVSITDLLTGAPGLNQIPKWDGSDWAPAADGGGGGNGTDLYWGIVDTPLGTNPFIAGANETLSMVSVDLDITGTSGNDTVRYAYGAQSVDDVNINFGNGTGQVNSNDILFEFLAGATYQSLQQYLTVDGSSGILTGGALTSNGDGTVSVSAVTGLIRTVNSETSPIVFFDAAGNASMSLVDDSINYVYAEWNLGNPRIRVTTSQAILFNVTNAVFAGIFRSGNTLHIQNTVSQYADYVHRNNLRNFEVDGVIRVNGQVTIDNGNLTIAITAGAMYAGIQRITTNAIDTGGGDTIPFYWTDDSGATWTSVITQVLNNTQYNDITSGLTALTANRYATLWVYVDYDGEDYHGVYGRGDYTLIQAEDAQPPTVLPNVIADYANLVAKIIIQKSDTTMIIFTPFGTQFTGNFAENHNDLGALQGGQAAQYFHLTTAEHTELTAWLDGVTLGASGALTLPSGQNFAIGSDIWNTGDLINMAKAANANLGDITTSGGVWTVGNDSHSHTGNTVSSISVGNTSLAVGSPLILTVDLLEIGNATTAALGASSYNGNHFDVTGGNVSLDVNMTYAAIEFIIDGGDGNVTTGIKGDLEVPWDVTINRVTMLGADTGNTTIDLWVDTYANFPPTDADSITAAAVPTMNGNKYQDSTLSGWTTALNEGDIIRYNVDSATGMTRVTISLRVTKT